MLELTRKQESFRNEDDDRSERTPLDDDLMVTVDMKYQLLDQAIELTEGKFQLFLAILCSFANFVDAVEVSMMGVLYSPLMEDFNINEKQLALSPSLTNLGMFCGAIGFGVLSDYVGRKNTLRVSMLMCCVFGFLSSFMQTIGSFSAMRFFLGAGYGGNLVTSTTLLVEYVSSKTRGAYVMLTSVGFGIGAVMITGIAFAVVPTWGWRPLVRLAASFALPTVILLYFIPESPRFLIMRKRYEECYLTMKQVAVMNRVSLPPNFRQIMMAKDDEGIRSKKVIPKCCKVPSSLFHGRVWVILLPLAGCWLLNSFANTINIFLPYHASQTYPLEENIEFLIAITQACGQLAGTMVQLLLVNYVGRLPQIRAGFLASAIILLALGLKGSSSFALFYSVAFFNQFMEQFIIGTLYLYTPEAFSTLIRQSAFSVCMSCHRLAPVVAPFAVAALDMSSAGFDSTSYVFMSLFILGGVFSFLLRHETFRTALPESVWGFPELKETEISDIDTHEIRV